MLVVLAVALAACSGGRRAVEPSGTVTSTLPSTAVKLAQGGAVIIGVPYLPTNLNPSTPAGANRVTQMVMSQVWPQPFVTDPQFLNETTGFLEGAELVSLQPETIAYHIAPGAKWADGVPISAADFIWNWHQQLAHAATSGVAGVLPGYADIASVTSSDNGQTVTVVFKATYGEWEGLFQNLVPAHIGTTIGWDGFTPDSLRDVVSGGPFSIESYSPGNELVLRRNTSWAGTAPHLDSIVFKVIHGGSPAIWAAMKSGKIQVGEVEPEADGAARATAAGLDSATTLSPVLWQICFNVTDAGLAEPAIRQAIALATDRTELVADTIGLADPGVPVAQNHVYLLDDPGWSSDPGPYESVDDLGAESLLEAAGYVMSPSGYLTHAGQPFTLTLTAPSGLPFISSVEAVFQAQMKDAGVTVRFVNVPLSRLLAQVLPSSQYQMALVPFLGQAFQSWTEPAYSPALVAPSAPVAAGASGSSGVGATGATGVSGGGDSPAVVGPPLAVGPMAGAAGSPVGPSVESLDVSAMSDPAVTSLYAEAESEIDPPTARRLYGEIDALLWQDLPTLPLFQMPVTLLTAHDLVNVQESPTPVGYMWNAADWAIALNLPAPAPAG